MKIHTARHTFATLLLSLKEDPKLVSELLGHANIHTTLQIYHHVLEENRARAADAMDLLLGEKSADEASEMPPQIAEK